MGLGVCERFKKKCKKLEKEDFEPVRLLRKRRRSGRRVSSLTERCMMGKLFQASRENQQDPTGLLTLH